MPVLVSKAVEQQMLLEEERREADGLREKVTTLAWQLEGSMVRPGSTGLQ